MFHKGSISQNIHANISFSGLGSNLQHALKSQPDMIYHSSKLGYSVKLSGLIQIGKKFKSGMSVGYFRLGDSRLRNAGYSQNNTDIFGVYYPWSVVKYRDIVSLNYYSISIIGLYQIKSKVCVRIDLNNLILANNQIKRKVYVSNFEADYAEEIWYTNTISNIKKLVIAPEIFVNFNLSKHTDFEISLLKSITSVFQDRNIYHQALKLSYIYKFD